MALTSDDVDQLDTLPALTAPTVSTDEIPVWRTGQPLPLYKTTLGGALAGITNSSSSTSGQVLTSTGPTTTPTFQDNKTVISYVIDGGGSAIGTGVKGQLSIPFACTIKSATLLADQSGSAVVDIWVAPFGAALPTVSNTITAGAYPTLSSAVTSQNSTLTGWTKAIAANSVIVYNVRSASTVTRLTIALAVA